MNNNIFEKIENQSQTLNEVADKLNGVSVEDLYALAKRTWDYKDYVMAQKYYNHISLLHPLDWKAPFMASLCGCLEGANVMEWEYRPKNVSRYYESTVAYIQNRDIDEEEKNKDILQVVEITFDIWREYIRLYLIPENKTSFDEFCPNFKRELQKAFMAFIKNLDGYSADVFRTKQGEICKTLAAFLSDYCSKDHSVAIEKEDLEKYILPYHGDIHLEENVENTVLTPEQEKEIKLKGKCYLVYKDKVLEKRLKRRSLIPAILLLISIFTANIIPAIIGKDKWTLIGLIIVIPVDIILFIRGIGSRKGIRQDVSFYQSRWKYRETSGGAVICETRSTIVRIISVSIISAFSTGGNILLCIIGVQRIADLMPALIPIMIVSFVVQTICALIFALTDISDYDCIRRFEYHGKMYYFDK